MLWLGLGFGLLFGILVGFTMSPSKYILDFWAVVGTWLSSIATIVAVFTSVHFSLKSQRLLTPSLSVYSHAVVGSDPVLLLRIINNSQAPSFLDSFFITCNGKILYLLHSDYLDDAGKSALKEPLMHLGESVDLHFDFKYFTSKDIANAISNQPYLSLSIKVITTTRPYFCPFPLHLYNYLASISKTH